MERAKYRPAVDRKAIVLGDMLWPMSRVPVTHSAPPLENKDTGFAGLGLRRGE